LRHVGALGQVADRERLDRLGEQDGEEPELLLRAEEGDERRGPIHILDDIIENVDVKGSVASLGSSRTISGPNIP
jgi:hypothetical protein